MLLAHSSSKLPLFSVISCLMKDHNHKTISALIHGFYVLFTEISPVQYESNLFVAICLRFVQHKLKLGNIIDAARILLVKKRLPIVCIVGNRIVEDRQIFIIFCISILSHLDITGLAVLVCSIVSIVFSLLDTPVSQNADSQ